MFENVRSSVAFPEFSKRLDQYVKHADTFFSRELVEILGEQFHYVDANYVQIKNEKFIGGVATSQRTESLLDIYQWYSEQDMMMSHINSNKNTLLKRSAPIVKVTDLMSLDEYPDSEYLKFLQSVDFYYIAILVFPEFRINFFKEQKEGDFTEREDSILAGIHKLLTCKQEEHAEQCRAQAAEKLKNSLMDDLDIGYMIFDSRANMLEFNNCALRYASLLFEKTNTKELFEEIVSLCEKESATGNVSAAYKLKGYHISMRCLPQLQKDEIEMLYYFTITRNEDFDKLLGDNAKHFQNLTKRERDVMDAFCEGMDYHEIAKQLFISENTVRTHLKNIYRKVGIRNQRHIVKLYTEYRLLLKSEQNHKEHYL